jgi:hypothetical protein
VNAPATITSPVPIAPCHGDASRDFLLSQLRCASLRAKLAANELDSIGVASRGNPITSEYALEWLHEAGLQDCIGRVLERAE